MKYSSSNPWIRNEVDKPNSQDTPTNDYSYHCEIEIKEYESVQEEERGYNKTWPVFVILKFVF